MTNSTPVKERSTTTACRCGGSLESFVRIPSVPVLVTRIFADPGEAAAVPRGELDLGFCATCGMIANVAFDASKVDYAADYENSQMFSEVFREYARGLARDLVGRFALGDGRVVEIGCGQGDFLELMVEEGLASGVGFDPAHRGAPVSDDGRLRFVRDVYDERHGAEPADVVVCRHVLEHVEEPFELLCAVREALEEQRVPVYFEVPNGEFVLSASGMWDLIYQHVSYFTAPSLWSLFRRAGFIVDRVEAVFDGQFLAVEARPGGSPDGADVDAAAVRRVATRVEAFARLWDETARHWDDRAGSWAEGDGDVVLWGAGAKGLSFLNLTGAGDVVSCVVDVNPRKQGTFVPPRGIQVVAPEDLGHRDVDVVVISNRAYEPEIRESLAELGLDPEVAVL